MSRKNGGIIGPANTPVGGLFKGVAGGVWRMNDVANFVGNSQWPKAPENIDNSLRFDDGSSDFLSRTPSSESNRKTWTWSGWLKMGVGSNGRIFSSGTSGTEKTEIAIAGVTNSVGLNVRLRNDSGDGNKSVTLSALQRDPSAWYHIVVAIDTTQATDTNRIKIYINGELQTDFSSASYPGQNVDTYINSTNQHNVGALYSGSTGSYYDGYLAECVFIDGQQLDPTSFGEFDTTTGIWKPKKIGAFASAGTNSFYLDFKDSSNVGKDASGLSNNFTVNNLTSIDQSTDTCVENFCTLNPLTAQVGGFSLAQGNTEIQMDNTNEKRGALGTFGLTQGKWYWEAKYVSRSNPTFAQVGITDANTDEKQGYGEYDYSYRGETSDSNGRKVNNGTFTSYGDTYTTGDIIGVALDLDNNKIFFSKNGTFQASGNPVDGSNPTFTITDPSSTDGGAYFAAIGKEDADTGTFSFNFGSPSFSISSGNSDANGFGNFEYAVPSGYYALNTSNLNTYG
jgi:hypothetical protein